MPVTTAISDKTSRTGKIILADQNESYIETQRAAVENCVIKKLKNQSKGFFLFILQQQAWDYYLTSWSCIG